MELTYKDEASIIIIGAGMAGLSAAKHLNEMGFHNVTILEARERIGGRIHTVYSGFNFLEMGAQWIHGEECNVIHDLALQNNLVRKESNEFYQHLKEGFSVLASQKSKELFHQMLETFLEDIDQDKDVSPSTSTSLGNYYLSKYTKFKEGLGNASQTNDIADSIYDWIVRFESHITGSDHLQDVSYLKFPLYIECKGNPVIDLSNGYASVLEAIMSEIPKSWLEIKKEVTRIHWGQKSKVELADGSQREADHIIVTIPLGVLKKNAINLFIPSLPEKKMNAINSLGFGAVEKIVLFFEEPFWKEGDIFIPFWLDGKNHRGFSNEAAFGKDQKEQHDAWTGVTDLSSTWPRFIVYFTTHFSHPYAVQVWLSGEGARFAGTLEDDQVSLGCLKVLASILKDENLPKPSKILRSNWSSDRLSYGSYSNISVSCDANNALPADLAETLMSTTQAGENWPSLLFAGEATHYCFFSTVHGAYETGLREATRLYNFHKERKALMSKKVIIVGAGISGLSAALELSKSGVDKIFLLEANSRIGGRILSIPFGSGVLELGAQWVHGQVGNSVFEFASKENLLSDPKSDFSVEGTGHFVSSLGQKLDLTLVDEVIMVLDGIKEGLTEQSNNPTVGEIYRDEFNEYLNSFPDDSKDIRSIKIALYHWYVRFEIIDNSCNSLHHLSAKGFSEWKDCPGVPLINFKNGFEQLVSSYQNKLGSNVELKLNAPVQKVDWEGNSPFVMLENGEKIYGDHVIVTASLGFLKERKETFFHPCLPEEKSQALKCYGFGTVNKLYLVFKKPFWSKDDLGFQLVWLPGDSKTHKQTLSKPIYDDGFPLWAHGISGFDTVRGQPNILVGWIGGLSAVEVENETDNRVMEVCHSLLMNFLGNKHLEAPVNIIRSSWTSNPYIRGSYSHRLKSYGPGDDCYTTLISPLLNSNNTPLVLFAGEATDLHFFSSVHGALNSGYREAHRLLDFWKLLVHVKD